MNLISLPQRVSGGCNRADGTWNADKIFASLKQLREKKAESL